MRYPQKFYPKVSPGEHFNSDEYVSNEEPKFEQYPRSNIQGSPVLC